VYPTPKPSGGQHAQPAQLVPHRPDAVPKTGIADTVSAAWVQALDAAEDVVRGGHLHPFQVTVDGHAARIVPAHTGSNHNDVQQTVAMIDSLRLDLITD
jgi:hypothetical protein